MSGIATKLWLTLTHTSARGLCSRTGHACTQNLCAVLCDFGHLKRLKGEDAFVDGSEWFRFARDEGHVRPVVFA